MSKDFSAMLSIIVPVYNSKKYLKSFITNVFESVNMPTFELIFIDDGSSDGTLQFLKKEEEIHENILVLEQTHKLQSEARNLGMDHANGKYLSFLDVDDSFSTDFFEKMMKKIEKHKLVISGIYRVISDTVEINESYSSIQGTKSKTEMLTTYLTDRVEMDSGLWNKLFENNIIKENRIRFKNKNFLEDTLFVFKYLTSIEPKDINYINEPLYSYYRNSNTTTTVFQDDMDQLADSFVSSIAEDLTECDLKQALVRDLIFNVQCRTYTYVLHRHILDDSHWTRQKQKIFLKENFAGLKNSVNVSNKYRVGMLFAFYFPLLYTWLYRKFKQNR